MIYFIVNPAAGSGKGAKAVPIIERVMAAHGAAYAIIHTEKSDDDYRRVSELIDYGREAAIVSVGGDGTSQEYAGLAVGKNAGFGVIPVGSGNDLLYSIPGMHRKFRSFDEKITFYAEKIAAGKTAAIDAVTVNGRYFINIAGTGLDIRVLKGALPLKKRLGGSAYFISLIKNVFTYKPEKMRLTIDGAEQTGEYALLAIANGSYYGGHMRVVPPAVADDGLLTVCVVRRMLKIKLLAMFPLVKPGWHTRI